MKSYDIKIIKKISLINERLEFIKIIKNTSEKFEDPKLNKWSFVDYSSMHPHRHFDSLIIYLLLTCFDFLGQGEEGEYLDFGSYLREKDNNRRDDLIKNLELSLEIKLIEKIKQTHDEYLNKHGATKTFYRFIDEMLSNEERNILFSSFYIQKIESCTDGNNNWSNLLDTINDDTTKKKYLYTLRNSYTHKMISIGSANKGLFPTHSDMMTRGYVCSLSIPCSKKEDNKFYVYYFKNWPDILMELIESHISRKYPDELEHIKKFG